MRSASIPLALVIVAAGCMPHPAVSRFRSDFGCTSGEATELVPGVYGVEGCGVNASYVCEAQQGGGTICVRESRGRATVRHPAEDEPRRVREARLTLEDGADAVRLRIEVAGSPALVYDPEREPTAVRVTSDTQPCAGASLGGGSGAELTGSALPEPPRDEDAPDEDAPDEDAPGEDAQGFAWPLRALARYASEDSLTLTICGTEIELRGTEMQMFRGFVARAGELRPSGGATPDVPEEEEPEAGPAPAPEEETAPAQDP